MKKILLTTAAFAILTPLSANGQNIHEGTGHLMLSLGYYDVLDDQDGLDIRAEYRPNSVVFIDNLRPFVGVEATAQGSLWAGGGLIYDLPFGTNQNWHFSPSFGAGLYTHGGDDLDLDYPIQFRTQLEVSYEFKDESRLGVSFSHMSNAGLGDHNPGTEVIGLQYSIPIDRIF
ncbi:MAG: acyloxyacyl hydrolase [Micavibrio sp.]|nr:acyloxyacyl hydrolase [Micavibrio sp.]